MTNDQSKDRAIVYTLIKNNMLAFVFVVGIHFLCFAASSRESMAVSDLSAQGVSQSDASIISDRLRNALFVNGVFTVVERSQMEQILKEQGFQQSGCTSDACAVEAGQLLGVQYITVGSVGLIGKTYTLNVRLIDVRTGRIIRIASDDCKGEIENLLTKSVAKIADQLSKVVQETAAHGQASLSTNNPGEVSTPQSPSSSANNGQAQINSGTQSNSAFAHSEMKKVPKSRIVLKILSGSAAVCAVGAGLYFNNAVAMQASKSNDLRSQYITAGGTMDDNAYLSQAKTYSDKAKTYSNYRAISYIAAGLCAAGFTLTFIF